MSDRSLSKNAAWNIAEAVGSSVVLFALYKLILARLGVSALGIWSLVLATTSLARIADLGAAGGLGRYVALAQARNATPDEAVVYVETAFITNALFYGLLSLAIYWPAWHGLAAVTRGPATAEARQLLPFAIASFALMNVANVITAALVGFHRSYQKSMVVLAALVVQVAVAASLIDRLGLRAVAIGQLIQYALVALVGWPLILRNGGRQKIFLPHRISRSAIRELVGFGLRLQVLNLASFPFEPITKFVFSTVGGLHALGLYELASRGFLQVRQVIVAPSQNLPPMFAARYREGLKELRPLYARAAAIMIVGGAVTMGGLAISSPAISYAWLGRVEPLFVLYSVVLAAGWFCNIAAAPGYHLGVGSGRLRWNIIGAITTTSLAGGLGVLLGRLVGPFAVAGGAMAAVALGSLLTWLMNCRDLNLSVTPNRAEWADLFQNIEARSRNLLALGTKA